MNKDTINIKAEGDHVEAEDKMSNYLTINIENESIESKAFVQKSNEVPKKGFEKASNFIILKIKEKLGIDLADQRTQLIIYALGIFIFYMLYGIIQEHM